MRRVAQSGSYESEKVNRTDNPVTFNEERGETILGKKEHDGNGWWRKKSGHGDIPIPRHQSEQCAHRGAQGKEGTSYLRLSGKKRFKPF